LYNHCNICNILIYFCNIHLKHFQYISEIFETLETYACNMHFQRNITLLLGRMELVDGAEVGGNTSSLSVRQQSGEHCTGEHHLREAMSIPGEQEGRGEHLWLAWHSVGRASTHCAGHENHSCTMRPRDWEEGVGPAYGSVEFTHGHRC
jgi:hypothetical protein